ncbi:neo-calmodulin-like [Branchiostoma floridae x Branchiostoma japonicum]
MASSKVSKVFSEYDRNGDDTIDAREIQAALKSLDLNPSQQFVERVQSKADANGDGKVTKEEFGRVVAIFEEIKELRKVFQENDQDASGGMSFDEMRKKAMTFYTTHADKYGGGRAMQVMNHYAGNKSKQMSVDDFLDIMFKDSF